MPLQRFNTVRVNRDDVLKLESVNYNSEEVEIGSRVSFNQIEQVKLQSAKEGLMDIEQVYRGNPKNYVFYNAGRYVIGYKAYKDRSLSGPKDIFLLCKPVNMTNVEIYQPVDYSADSAINAFKEAGLFSLVKDAIEDHNILVKRLWKTILKPEEVDLLSEVYIDYLC